MEKEQAITYIKERLDQDVSRPEIVRGLADQLHAPEAVVSKFVAQVEADYRKNQPPPMPKPATQQPVKLPPWLEELSTGQNLYGDLDSSPSWTQSSTTAASPAWELEAHAFVIAQLKNDRLHSDIASELADRLAIPREQAESMVSEIDAQQKSAQRSTISNTADATEFVRHAYTQGRPKLEISTEMAMRTGRPQNQIDKFVAQTITQLEKSPTQGNPLRSGPSATGLDTPQMVKYVVSEFSKQRKRSDIVMALCERTGAGWQEAQRFVAQVYAEHHTRINARKNILIVPMGIGAIVLGLLLTIGSAYPVVIWFSKGSSELQTFAASRGWIGNFIQVAPYLFFLGIGLMVGGIVGLVTALRSQME
jgi:hypothetical protein